MKKIPFEQNTKADLTPEEIAEFRKQYGNVYRIGDDQVFAFIHKPDRIILDAANEASKKRATMFEETILRNCWLAGDKRILEDDDYFLGARAILGDVITFKTLELKNC